MTLAAHLLGLWLFLTSLHLLFRLHLPFLSCSRWLGGVCKVSRPAPTCSPPVLSQGCHLLSQAGPHGGLSPMNYPFSCSLILGLCHLLSPSEASPRSLPFLLTPRTDHQASVGKRQRVPSHRPRGVKSKSKGSAEGSLLLVLSRGLPLLPVSSSPLLMGTPVIVD